MVLAEANRLIEVTEGEKVFKIPAIQAVVRTMIAVAANGDAKAGGKILDVVASAESARAIAAQGFLEQAIQYKEEHLPTFEEHEREGGAPPDIYPDPRDVLIDKHTGKVTVDGPETKEEAAARKAFWEIALQKTPRYFDVKVALKQDPKNRALRKEFNKLQPYIDFLKEESERNFRRKALQQSLRAMEPQPAEQEDEESDNPDGQG